jgi:hypothetical protein
MAVLADLYGRKRMFYIRRRTVLSGPLSSAGFAPEHFWLSYSVRCRAPAPERCSR